MMQELENLLKKLDSSTFDGEETTHAPMKWNLEYSPSRLESKTAYPGMNMDTVTEIGYDQQYNVISYFVEQNGQRSNYTTDEIDQLMDTGILSNILKHDPRYILHNCKDDRQIGPDTYEVKVYDKDMQEMEEDADEMSQIMGDAAYVEQWAEFYLKNDDLQKMIIKTKYVKKNKEKVFTEIDFK